MSTLAKGAEDFHTGSSLEHPSNSTEVSASAMQINPDETELSERWTQLQFTWSGKSFMLEVADSDRSVYYDTSPSLPLIAV
jgi:hypothetical protein